MEKFTKKSIEKSQFLDKIISKIYIAYVELISRSSKITITGLEDRSLMKNSIVGFWHGESYGLSILLREIKDEEKDMSVVVTIDKRGNYIEDIISKYKVKALRMPDGLKMKGFFRELKQVASRENSSLCISLDGPVGPYREPKKVGFKLSNENNKPYVIVDSKFSRKITLKSRWDNYIIPLPFGRIDFDIKNLGVIKDEDIKNFEEYRKIIV